MKTYHGERAARGCEVTVDGTPLQKRSDLTGNATTPFDWGYVGTGQLSVALLSDFLGDDSKVKALAETFEHKVVAELPKKSWTRTDRDFAAALEPFKDVDGDGGNAGAAFGDMPIETTSLAVKPVETQDTAGVASMVFCYFCEADGKVTEAAYAIVIQTNGVAKSGKLAAQIAKRNANHRKTPHHLVALL
jgi:hypothetical protein